MMLIMIYNWRLFSNSDFLCLSGISLTEEQWSIFKNNLPAIEKAIKKMESRWYKGVMIYIHTSLIKDILSSFACIFLVNILLHGALLMLWTILGPGVTVNHVLFKCFATWIGRAISGKTLEQSYHESHFKLNTLFCYFLQYRFYPFLREGFQIYSQPKNHK